MQESIMADWETLRLLEHHKKIKEIEKQVRATFKNKEINNVEPITRGLHLRAKKIGKGIQSEIGNCRAS